MTRERDEVPVSPLEGIPERSGGAPSRGETDSEVPERAQRRQFTAQYKERIVREAEACRASGEVAALLRREGLYSSHLAKWREQRSTGLSPRQRGRKAKDEGAAKRLAQLERENERLRKQLRQSEVIIEAQKKLSRLLEEIHQDAKSS